MVSNEKGEACSSSEVEGGNGTVLEQPGEGAVLASGLAQGLAEKGCCGEADRYCQRQCDVHGEVGRLAMLSIFLGNSVGLHQAGLV